MIGLSTSWFGGRFQSFAEQIEEVRKLGFSQIEIGLSQVAPPGSSALKTLDLYEVKAPSLRCGCRAAFSREYRECEWLSAKEQGTRAQALQSVLTDIQLAKQTKSSSVILPAGFVDNENHKVPTNRLEYLDRACRSLFGLAQQEPNVKLAIETPRAANFLPYPNELEGIFDELGKYNVFYFHDVVHAAALEKTAGIAQGEWLEKFVDRCIGMRLGDLMRTEIKAPPGTGEIDWKLIAGYLPSNSIRTLDIHPKHDVDALMGAVRFLEKFGF